MSGSQGNVTSACFTHVFEGICETVRFSGWPSGRTAELGGEPWGAFVSQRVLDGSR